MQPERNAPVLQALGWIRQGRVHGQLECALKMSRKIMSRSSQTERVQANWKGALAAIQAEHGSNELTASYPVPSTLINPGQALGAGELSAFIFRCPQPVQTVWMEKPFGKLTSKC